MRNSVELDIRSGVPMDLLDWEYRDDASEAGAAFDLLASWGQLQRVQPWDLSLVEEHPKIQQVLKTDAHLLLKAALPVFRTDLWQESLTARAKLWEDAETEEDEEELSDSGLRLFLELDNMGLAAWTALSLDPKSAPWKEVRGKISHCRSLFAAEAWRFDSVMHYAARMRLAWRSDLLAFDPGLADASCIYATLLGAMRDAGIR